MTYADTRMGKERLWHKQCIVDGLHSEKIECLNPGHDEGAL